MLTTELLCSLLTPAVDDNDLYLNMNILNPKLGERTYNTAVGCRSTRVFMSSKVVENRALYSSSTRMAQKNYLVHLHFNKPDVDEQP